MLGRERVTRARSRWRPGDLTRLARIHGSDKWGGHAYTPLYQRYLAPLRHRPIALLEIGIGGYADPLAGGASLRMWRDYFPHGRIYGIDIHPKHGVDAPRITTFRGSQADPAFLADVVGSTGPLDVIIDDGSHVNADVIAAFHLLFPHLRDGGLYFVEDTQTSHWPAFGGDPALPPPPGTTLHFFQRLADGLNHAEWLRPGYRPTELDRTVAGIHFHHNLIVVEKGRNEDGSNIVEDNRPNRITGGA